MRTTELNLKNLKDSVLIPSKAGLNADAIEKD